MSLLLYERKQNRVCDCCVSNMVICAPLCAYIQHCDVCACRWNFKDGRPASNFDTFPIALLTVFQVSGPWLHQDSAIKQTAVLPPSLVAHDYPKTGPSNRLLYSLLPLWPMTAPRQGHQTDCCTPSFPCGP